MLSVVPRCLICRATFSFKRHHRKPQDETGQYRKYELQIDRIGLWSGRKPVFRTVQMLDVESQKHDQVCCRQRAECLLPIQPASHSGIPYRNQRILAEHSPLESFEDQNFFDILRFRIRNAQRSATSSMILAVGLPAPWPARVSIRIRTGLSPA